MSVETTARLCQECGSPLSGRVDKRFCSDQCRNSYNNRKKTYSNTYTRKVNGTLKLNRRILENLLNGREKTRIHRQSLKKRGFDFQYFTNIYTTKKGHEYRFCYEYGYLELEEGWLAVVKRKRYLEK